MLISIVLYLLGIPLWMILGMLILVFWNRRRVKNQAGIIPIKIKPESDSNEDSKWPRSVSYMQWVHDVAIVRKAPALIYTIPYAIKNIESMPQDADPEEVKGLGDHPKVARVRLDDDSIIQVALSEVHPDLAPERYQESTG